MIKNKKLSNTEAIKKIEFRYEIYRTLLSIIISLALVLIVVSFVSDDPVKALKGLLLGPLSSRRRFANVIEFMIPLTFTGLALTLVFKTNRFNLSADGAFYGGAMVAACIGVFSPFPPFVTIILALVFSTLVGAFIGFIPAIIGLKFKANELVTSLMLNYVIGFMVVLTLNYYLRDTYAVAIQSVPMKDGVNLGLMIPKTRIHYGILILFAVVIISAIVLYRTKWGYILRTTGSNEKFAKYSGINTPIVIVIGQMVGTAIAGLGGGVEMLGMYTTFKWAASPLYGFDGVIVTTLAHSNPWLTPIAAFFLAYIRVGADVVNRTTNVPAEIIAVVQSTIILFIASKAFLGTMKEKAIIKQSGIDDKKGE